LSQVRAQWPIPLEQAVNYHLDNGSLNLRIPGLAWTAENIADIWFAANEWGPIAANGQQQWHMRDGTLELNAPLGDIPPDGRGTLPGLLVVTERSGDASLTRGFDINAKPSSAAPSEGTAESTGMAAALLFAFLGGLILNLMPCVLPVLAIKAMSLTQQAHADDKHGTLGHGLAYAGGVLISVLALAGSLIALRAGGESLGWGFQLQSPLIITLLAYLMLLVGLNLSGVYEFGGRLMGLGQSGGNNNAFMTGVLAVVVASPCTAPFMGVALGFALTQPAALALGVFAALGLGFALPMVLLSAWPGLIRRIPKPGQWMVVFKQFLAFPLYGTAAWLLWVLAQQVDQAGLALALAGLLSVAMAAWLWGMNKPLAHGLSALTLILAAGLAWGLNPKATEPDQAMAWSPEKVENYLAEGRPVFVNFTAAWCISCKVNERVALSTDAVRRVMDENNIAYLKGDWTNRDERIGTELARHGRSGVPLYLFYRPGQTQATVLPQLLTEGIVLDALNSL
ncbi:MAG: protein-disulfide reductase DsbD family protein, partial [Gammaproteobacteria bacterium]